MDSESFHQDMGAASASNYHSFGMAAANNYHSFGANPGNNYRSNMLSLGETFQRELNDIFNELMRKMQDEFNSEVCSKIEEWNEMHRRKEMEMEMMLKEENKRREQRLRQEYEQRSREEKQKVKEELQQKKTRIVQLEEMWVKSMEEIDKELTGIHDKIKDSLAAISRRQYEEWRVGMTDEESRSKSPSQRHRKQNLTRREEGDDLPQSPEGASSSAFDALWMECQDEWHELKREIQQQHEDELNMMEMVLKEKIRAKFFPSE